MSIGKRLRVMRSRSLTQRRSRFAFIPLASATLAIETPALGPTWHSMRRRILVLRALHLKYLAVLQSDCGQCSAPHAASIQRDQIGPND
jgi:hypothetical protein